MDEKSFIDRRKYVRFDHEQGINVAIKADFDPGKYRGMALSLARNVSMEGVGFTSERLFPCGSMVDLTIKIEGFDSPVSLCGKVVWSNPLSSRKGKEACDTGIKLYASGTPDERKFAAYIYERTINELR